EGGNRTVTFLEIFKGVFNKFTAATGGRGVSGSEHFPGKGGGSGFADKRQNFRREGGNNKIKKEAILTFPRGVIGVDGGDSVGEASVEKAGAALVM
ncbi:hypothetical protein Dimus_015519, partial [Dionaea muscipula]